MEGRLNDWINGVMDIDEQMDNLVGVWVVKHRERWTNVLIKQRKTI